MTNNIKYFNKPPGLLPMYGKALLSKRTVAEGELQLPDVSAELIGASTGGARLAHYRNVCGFINRATIPATWPHVLAFPLHLKVLTDKQFPLPLLGLVHLRNRINQHRPIGEGEPLDLRVTLGKQAQTARGLEFDLITEARSAGRLVWEENSTTLFRQPEKSAEKNGSKQPPALTEYEHNHDITVSESIGRQYASASGDRNPIHLYPLTAKLFGFPRAIAHGMWSKARVLSILEQQHGWRDDGLSIDCSFKKPLFIPGHVQLNWQQPKAKEWDYHLLNAAGDAPHLSGKVQWQG